MPSGYTAQCVNRAKKLSWGRWGRTFVALAAAAMLGASSGVPPAAGPQVHVAGGLLEGLVDSATGILVFRGIPYAAPPVGELRWRPPRPPRGWRGVRRADRLGHNCMQRQVYDDITPFTTGVSEDCLFLNVWTSGVDGPARPVMVWIHGGGLSAGFGGEERHNGARLAQKGVVVVTLNYRLGPFGFLVHPAIGAGNYGLMDQIAALEWVRQNIAAFGGDPQRVTIFGESAGGWSVGALVASPRAKGLFTGAIMESGTGIDAERRASAESVGVRFAGMVGVHGDGGNTAAALRSVSADVLLAADRIYGVSALVIDGEVLPHPVDSAFANGSANAVPVILGSNADEDNMIFGAPARAVARLITSHGGRAFLYVFSRSANTQGAYHSSEITFVFGRPRPLLAEAGTTPYDSTLAETMSDYWVAFATNGDPNGGTRPNWPAYDTTREPYMDLGADVGVKYEYRHVLFDSLDRIARTHAAVRP